jgi:formate dehydrogenase maturation protein FdhE
MTEKKGHFEKGVWVDEPAAPEKNEVQIDARIEAATRSVISAIDDAAKVTRDLVTTEEGKKHIEKTMKETTAGVQKAFDEILKRAKSEMDKTIKSIK